MVQSLWYHWSMSLIDDAALAAALTALAPGWRRDGSMLVRALRFPSFRDAIDFIVRVADAAEAADHHPSLMNTFCDVEVRLSTHEVGGITARDLALARVVDASVGSGVDRGR
jgi:4a-hydroxytetrahydrobiopterin dehydratase